MDNLMQPINTLLDALFFGIINPLFSLLGRGLELILLRPLQMLQFPPALQIVLVAVVTALFSLYLRRLIKVEEKEQDFRKKFIAKKKQQEELHRISDWKSREKFAKAMDDDIDEDFNSYLAGRFARYGVAYLLPIFLVQYWLESFTSYTIVIVLPENSFGLSGIPVLVVFLVSYCLSLLFYFKILRKKKKVSHQAVLTV